MTDYVGQQLGNYKLLRLLGSGGFAKVYLGQHIHLNTNAAIKLLRAHLVDADEEDFKREAQIIAKLDHPHIVRVLDFAVEQDITFLVMEYAPNGSLRALHPRGHSIPLSTVLLYVRQIAGALQYAHDRYLIHRDVKPENMLLKSPGEVLLSDFGIAAIALSTNASGAYQGEGGTYPYMAPEQIKGRPVRASDQYALAICVYEWLTGARPFQGTRPEIAVQHLEAAPAPLCGPGLNIAPQVEDVVLKALSKNPKERFASIREFAEALHVAGNEDIALFTTTPDPFPNTVEVPRQGQQRDDSTPDADKPTHLQHWEEALLLPPQLPTNTPPNEPKQHDDGNTPPSQQQELTNSSRANPMQKRGQKSWIDRRRILLTVGLLMLVVLSSIGFLYFSNTSASSFSLHPPTGTNAPTAQFQSGSTVIPTSQLQPKSTASLGLQRTPGSTATPTPQLQPQKTPVAPPVPPAPPPTPRPTPTPIVTGPMQYYNQYTSGPPTKEYTAANSGTWSNGSPGYGTCQKNGTQGYDMVPKANGDTQVCISPYPAITSGNFAVQAAVTINYGTGADLGFGFTTPNTGTFYNGDYYFFGFCRVDDGRYCPARNVFLDHALNGALAQCMGPGPDATFSTTGSACSTTSSAIDTDQGATNVLTVVVIQGTIYLYLNATFIIEFVPHSPVNYSPYGKVGVAATQGSMPTDATFQSLKIWIKN
jgi:serine/threonine protein kinase